VADATALASETPSQTIDITGVKNASVFINLADQTDTDTLVIKGSKETTVIDTLVITKAGEQLDDLTITDIDEITHDAATLKAASITGQTIEFNAGSANDVITLDGTGAADTISLANFANAAGNATNFTVNGGDKADTITGSDFIDILNGGAGGDTLNGGDGADTITGGAGNDTMSGGDDTAADKFTMAESGTASAATATSLTATLAADDTITFGDGVDIITDFTAGTDDLVATVAGSTSLVNMVGSQVVANAVTNDTNNVGYGTWNADDNVFTFAAAFNATSAKDALFVAGDGSLKLTDTTAFVVIDDLSAALVAGDIIV
jgi:Ca2+-binding RTX toxin-like protein